MKDKLARVLAIIALVFMGIFVVTLTLTLVDYKMLGGGIGFIAMGAGVFTLMIFIALKADGRGYSITKMNNEIEMAKIEKELAEKEQKEKEEKEKQEQQEQIEGEKEEDVETAEENSSKDEPADERQEKE